MELTIEVIDKAQQTTQSMYRNTEILLELYRKVKFHVQTSIAEIDEELYISERKHLTDMVHELVDYDVTPQKHRIQERLAAKDMSLCLLEVMEDALIALKSYPDDGELYYRLIRYRYFDSFKNTNEDVMLMLGEMPYTTYYRKRKKAIQVYSSLLWGITKRREPSYEDGSELPFC